MIHNCNSEILLLDVCPRAAIIQRQKVMCLGMLTLALFEIEKNKRLDKWTIENERAGTSCFNKDKYQKQELNLKNQVRE